MKQKVILISVADDMGGMGDFLFALKLAKQMKISSSENLKVCVVTRAYGKQSIINIKGDKEFDVDVITPEEIKTTISHDMEVCGVIEGPVTNLGLLERIEHQSQLLDGAHTEKKSSDSITTKRTEKNFGPIPPAPKRQAQAGR